MASGLLLGLSHSPCTAVQRVLGFGLSCDTELGGSIEGAHRLGAYPVLSPWTKPYVQQIFAKDTMNHDLCQAPGYRDGDMLALGYSRGEGL